MNWVNQAALDLEVARDQGETSDLADRLEVRAVRDQSEWLDSPEYPEILESRVR